MATQEDVKVRLSAEGTQEVVNAFKRVQQESGKAKAGTDGLGSSFASMRGIIATLGLGAVVTGLAGLASRSINAADAIGDLAAASGLSTENLSVYAFAAREAGVSQEALEKSTIRFNKALADLQTGERGATEAFGRLGLTAADFVGLSPDQAMNRFAQALGTVEGSAGKVAVAQQILGRGGVELVEVFDALANEGFANVQQRAQEAGAVISQDLANAAGDAKRAMGQLEATLTSATNAFLGGFLPTFTEGAADVAAGSRGMSDEVRIFGQVVAAVITVVVSLFAAGGRSIGATVAQVSDGVTQLGAVARAALSGDFAGAANTATEALERQRAMLRQYATEMAGLAGDVKGAFASIGSGPVESANRVVQQSTAQSRQLIGEASEDQKKALEDRRQALQAALDGEVRALQKRQRDAEVLEAAAYEKGKTSLDGYVESRRAIIERAAAAEAALLAQKLGTATTDRERAAVQAEIDAAALGRTQQLAQLDREAETERQRLLEQRQQFEQRLLEAQGRRHDAAMAQLDAEVAKFQEVLTKQGVSAEEQAAKLAEFRNAGAANVEFDTARERADLARQELDNATAVARTEEDALRIERERLPVLRQQAAELMAAAQATGDQQKIADAQAYGAAVEAIGVKAVQAAGEYAMLRQAAYDSLVDGVANFLTTGIQEADSFGEAVQNMAGGVVQAMQQILAQMIAMQAVKSAFGAFGIPVPGGGGFAQGGVVRAATGGHIRGPGSGTSDSIPAWLSNGEFVVRSAVVRQPGVLSMLHALNRGTPSGIGARKPNGYAEGGLVATDGNATMAGGESRMVIDLAPGLTLRDLQTPAGRRVLVRALSESKRAARGALGV